MSLAIIVEFRTVTREVASSSAFGPTTKFDWSKTSLLIKLNVRENGG